MSIYLFDTYKYKIEGYRHFWSLLECIEQSYEITTGNFIHCKRVIFYCLPANSESVYSRPFFCIHCYLLHYHHIPDVQSSFIASSQDTAYKLFTHNAIKLRRSITLEANQLLHVLYVHFNLISLSFGQVSSLKSRAQGVRSICLQVPLTMRYAPASNTWLLIRQLKL